MLDEKEASPASPLEFKDDTGTSNVDDGTIKEITRQIKGFGDDIKSFHSSIEKDLSDVRKIAEDTKKGADDSETKELMAKLTASVSEKHSALDELLKKSSERTDKLETALNRSPSGGGKKEDDLEKEAIEFFEAKQSVGSGLNWNNRPTAESADIAGYQLWAKAFDSYLRSSDERSVDVKALSVGSNPTGGYLVPTQRSARIIQKIFESSPLRQLATVETIGTEALEVPVDTDEASVGWVGEEETRPTTSTPTVGIQRIPVHELYAKPKATQALLEDAAIDVEGWLSSKIADKMGRTEATAFVSGTGINQPRGILTYASGSAGARGTILQYASGNATLVTADAIVAMPFQLKDAYRNSAAWLMKRSTVQAVMLLKDGNGQYLWRPGLVEGQPSSLAGYPMRFADDMPAVAAAALPIAFGDFGRGYTVVDRLGITTLRDPFSSKPFVEFYTRKRVGGDVVDFEAFALMVVSA